MDEAPIVVRLVTVEGDIDAPHAHGLYALGACRAAVAAAAAAGENGVEVTKARRVLLGDTLQYTVYGQPYGWTESGEKRT